MKNNIYLVFSDSQAPLPRRTKIVERFIKICHMRRLITCGWPARFAALEIAPTRVKQFPCLIGRQKAFRNSEVLPLIVRRPWREEYEQIKGNC